MTDRPTAFRSVPWRVVTVPRPTGTWMTYSDLWAIHGVKRGFLDKLIQQGKVHWFVCPERGQLYRWEDMELAVVEANAMEVEEALATPDER